jgi:hypothetical protein
MKLNQGSKRLACIVLIDQPQYECEYYITHYSIVIGEFKLCEVRISNPELNCILGLSVEH